MKVTTEVPLKLQRFGETPRVLTGGRGGCIFLFAPGGGGAGQAAEWPLYADRIYHEFAKNSWPQTVPFCSERSQPEKFLDNVRQKKSVFGSETRKNPDHKTSENAKGFVAPVEGKTVLSLWFKVVDANSRNLNLESADKRNLPATNNIQRAALKPPCVFEKLSKTSSGQG